MSKKTLAFVGQRIIKKSTLIIIYIEFEHISFTEKDKRGSFRACSIYLKLLFMEQKVNDLQMYALIDASAAPEVLETVKKVIATYGRRIRNGFVVTPHGEDNVIFFEVKKKECPIVEILSSLAGKYGLYPAYVIQENKDHLPKYAKNIWYMVDEVKFEIPDMDAEKLEAWKATYRQRLKEIYRDDSVFVKSFVYLGKSGTVHVMSFNSERSPKYRGTELGVPEWNDTMEGIIRWAGPSEVTKMSVRYTNL